MKKYCFVTSLLIVLFSCHHAADSKWAVKNDTMSSAATASTGVLPGLKNLQFAYNRDPSCGMPLKAGLLDTTTYKGKLYGFCSKECKDEFLTDPAGYTAKIK
jgi:YHS domain-containing protein